MNETDDTPGLLQSLDSLISFHEAAHILKKEGRYHEANDAECRAFDTNLNLAYNSNEWSAEVYSGKKNYSFDKGKLIAVRDITSEYHYSETITLMHMDYDKNIFRGAEITKKYDVIRDNDT